MPGASSLYWPRRRKVYFSRTHSPRTCICRVERYKICIQYTHNICIAPKTTLCYTHITHTHTHTHTHSLSLTHTHTHSCTNVLTHHTATQPHSPTSSLPHTLTPSPHTELIELHPPRLGHIYLAEGLVELCQVIIRVVEVLLQQQLLVALQVRQGGGRATHGVSE